jgi:hypothetical protein
MNIQSIELKVANMKKAQSFIIYPFKASDTVIVLQSEKSIATLDKQTGVFKINTKGCYFVHIPFAQEVELDDSLKQDIKRKYLAKQNGENGVIKLFG